MGLDTKDKALFGIIALLILALIGVVVWEKARYTALEEARQAESKRLEDAIAAKLGALTPQTGTNHDLEKAVAVLSAQYQGLAQLITAVRTQFPNAQVIGTGQVSTQNSSAANNATQTPSLPQTPAGTPKCLYSDADSGSIDIGAVELTTKNGTRMLVGEATAKRTGDKPSPLFTGTFQIDASKWLVAPSPDQYKPGWAFGVGSSFDRNGWGIGPAVSPPPISLKTWGQLEAVAAVTFGHAGDWRATAVGVWRSKKGNP